MAKRKIEVIWTIPAKKDLQTIYDYLSEISILIAERQINRIINRIDLLERGFTKLGQIEPLLVGRKDTYRYLVQDNYKIIYREIKNKIIIDIVFDTRQNPKNLKENLLKTSNK